MFGGWLLENITPARDGFFHVTLTEDPAYHAYSVVAEGMVYSKQITAGPIVLDEEALQEVDPDLWLEVTELPTKRELKDWEDLTEEQIAHLTPYVYEGKPKVRLAPPRKAKPEDLG